MTKKRLLVAAGIISIPVLAIAWWLGSPLFLDSEVNEDFPMSAGAAIPDNMTAEEVEAEIAGAAAEPATAADDGMPGESEPMSVAVGPFEDFDDFHQGSGTATIYQLADGSHVLRLEEFEVTNGPDLHVLLVPASNPDSADAIDGYVDLGSLKGNIGDQNYDLPLDVDPADFGSVVIYCQPFHVIFSTASLG